MHLICKRCGKKLKTLAAQAIGYGPVCYKKSGFYVPKRKSEASKEAIETFKLFENKE